MSAQNVANTVCTFTTLDLELGSAHDRLMQAVTRVAAHKNEQAVAHTLWAVGTLQVHPGDACLPVLQSVTRVPGSLRQEAVSQMQLGLQWLQEAGLQ